MKRRVTAVIVLVLAVAAYGTSSLGQHEPRKPRGLTLVFQDNFNGTRLDTRRWAPYFSPGNMGFGLRRPSAFALNGKGLLVVTAQEKQGVIVSGGMAAKKGFRYGRVQVRVRTEADPAGATSGVILTWPNSERWPIDGENDIYETGAARGSRRPFHSYVHYGANNLQYEFTHDVDGSRWHTLTMDWSPRAIKIYRDGKLVGVVRDRRAIPNVAHHVAIQLDAENNNPLARPVHMYVDYIRVWRR